MYRLKDNDLLKVELSAVLGGALMSLPLLVSLPVLANEQVTKATVLHDPTRPAVWSASVNSSGQTKAESDLVLNSVLKLTNDAYAVINNKIYRRGDEISGTKISQITHHSVTLADGRKLRVYQVITEIQGK